MATILIFTEESTQAAVVACISGTGAILMAKDILGEKLGLWEQIDNAKPL